MILYNVTVNVDQSVVEDWLTWMQTKHIPDVLNTGLFIENRLMRVLSTEEGEGSTFSVQYYLESMENYEVYRELFAPALQKEHVERYGSLCVAFRTLLESVD
jgi:hypothetical protein